MGVTLFAGEAEGRMDEVIRDAAAGTLKPIYNYIDDLPALEDAVTPFLPGNSVRKTIGNVTTFDAGRGCPFQCSFCTIINVQGRKSRCRSARRRRAHPAQELRARHRPFLHHRRQFRPQQGLGADLRPHDRAARTGTAWTCAF